MQVRAHAPEVLLMMQCGANPQGALPCVTELAALPGWWGLPAVKSGCVFVVDHAPFLRPGPRLVRPLDVVSCTASLCLTSQDYNHKGSGPCPAAGQIMLR